MFTFHIQLYCNTHKVHKLNEMCIYHDTCSIFDKGLNTVFP